MKSKTLFLLALLAASAPLARAVDIGWGNDPFGATDDPNTNLYMYNSHGGLLDNTYSFELGTWATGFTPTAANVNAWASNWKVIAAVTAPSSNGWVSLDPSDPGVNDPTQNAEYFTHYDRFNTNGTVQGGGSSIFSSGDQAYIWVFNSKSVTPGTEWALVTDMSPGPGGADDIWKLPDLTVTMNIPVEWSLSTADTAVFGEVNGVTGAGMQNVDPGTNRLQTFNPVSVVPEPGSAFLVMLAGVALRLRKRQRRD